MKVPVGTPGLQQALRLVFLGKLELIVDDLPFSVENLSWNKRKNLILSAAQKALRPAFRLAQPTILQIEPCNYCNLRCSACVHGNDLLQRKRSLLSFDRFKQVVDEVKDFVCIVFFWSWGEPFMNPESAKMISYAKQNGLLVHSSTNGHFFTSKQAAREVVSSGLDSLVFAVDGLDEKTYTRYREGGSLNKVICSIQNVVKVKQDLGLKSPLITLRFIVMQHNEHQVDQIESFARELGVDAVCFRTTALGRADVHKGEELAPRALEFRRYSDAGNNHSKDKFICHRPFANLTVFSGGEVVLCENDFNAEVSLGNLSRDPTIAHILENKRSREKLEAFRRDCMQYDFCEKCEFRNSRHKTLNIRTKMFGNCQFDA